jgi:hypothetical protein
MGNKRHQALCLSDNGMQERATEQPIKSMAVFAMNDGLIAKAWFFFP